MYLFITPTGDSRQMLCLHSAASDLASHPFTETLPWMLAFKRGYCLNPDQLMDVSITWRCHSAQVSECWSSSRC